MKKETIILLAIVGLMLLGIIVSFFVSYKKPNSIDLKQLPTKIIIPTRVGESFSSETGAVYISPTEKEYIEERLIADLRNKCPIKTDGFSINFDYKINLFVVTIKNKSNLNYEYYNKWMESAGYNLISQQYFRIE